MANSNITLLVLPREVLAIIFNALKLSEIRNLMLTCKELRDFISNDNNIWRLISKRMLIVHNRNSKQASLSWWNQCRIASHWSKGIFKSKVMVNMDSRYMPWIQYHNSERLLVSVGSELRCYSIPKKGLPNRRDPLWNIEVPTLKRNDIRTNDISRFVMNDDLIVCGNRDGCVTVLKVDQYGKSPKLLAHILDCHLHGRTEVTAVEMINTSSPVIVTGSSSSSIFNFWHMPSDFNGETIFNVAKTDITIPDDRGPRCFSIDRTNNKLAVGLSGNSRPILIDVSTTKILMQAETTRNLRHAVRDIQWHDENKIIYVTHSGKLQFIDTRTHEVIYDATDPFHSTLYCVKSDGLRSVIVGSSEYCRSVLFDERNSKRPKQIYFTAKKKSPVYCLDFDSTRLISAIDQCISVLNFDINTWTVDRLDYSYAFEVKT